MTKGAERVEYASPLEVKLIKKQENKLSGHFVNEVKVRVVLGLN